MAHPWFANHDALGYCTEDVVFCDRAREAGFRVLVDHDLSRELTHTGSVAISLNGGEKQ